MVGEWNGAPRNAQKIHSVGREKKSLLQPWKSFKKELTMWCRKEKQRELPNQRQERGQGVWPKIEGHGESSTSIGRKRDILHGHPEGDTDEKRGGKGIQKGPIKIDGGILEGDAATTLFMKATERCFGENAGRVIDEAQGRKGKRRGNVVETNWSGGERDANSLSHI